MSASGLTNPLLSLTTFDMSVLGVSEAGLFPGVIYVFSVYYRRHERSWRVAIFFGGAALAGAFGGILAFAIGKMDGIGGRKGWEWYVFLQCLNRVDLRYYERIFILEGILTVVISLLAYFVVPTWPHKAKFVRDEFPARRPHINNAFGNCIAHGVRESTSSSTT